jgi:hypothetical protein
MVEQQYQMHRAVDASTQTHQPVAGEVENSRAGGEDGQLGVLVLDQSGFVGCVLNVLLALKQVGGRFPAHEDIHIH